MRAREKSRLTLLTVTTALNFKEEEKQNDEFDDNDDLVLI